MRDFTHPCRTTQKQDFRMVTERWMRAHAALRVRSEHARAHVGPSPFCGDVESKYFRRSNIIGFGAELHRTFSSQNISELTYPCHLTPGKSHPTGLVYLHVSLLTITPVGKPSNWKLTCVRDHPDPTFILAIYQP